MLANQANAVQLVNNSRNESARRTLEHLWEYISVYMYLIMAFFGSQALRISFETLQGHHVPVC